MLDLLQDTLIIPVDAHIALLKKGSTDAPAQLRTDLILRRIPTTRQLEFTLVEVKCKAGILTASASQGLREEIEGQVNQTQSALANLFDPNHAIPDRLDRPLRNLLAGAVAPLLRGEGSAVWPATTRCGAAIPVAS